ncbi:MAG: class I SAM-dependent rRNA methyltransferase [Alphaproteobacteria bacterium]
MSAASLPSIHVLRGHARRLRHGHPWAYSNELRMDDDARALAPGSIVRLVDAGGEAIGCATFNPHSLIAARLIAHDAEQAIDGAFIRTRLEAAAGLRACLYDAPYWRLVHAEGDGLPGLVIDRFGDVFVCQPNTAGAERLMPDLLAALDAMFAPRAVVLRADSPMRTLEGLERHVRLAAGALEGAVDVEEGALRLLADPLEGQKTGWYFDQRESRSFVARLAGGGRMLDVYGYSGAFALHAAAAGAAQVIVVERSQAALALGERAAELNGVAARASFVRAEAFAEMARLAKAGERFDVVVADPPSFVRSRKELKPGLRGYRKMTRLAAALVAPGGYLFVASCSHNVAADAFAEAVGRGLVDSERGGRILRAAGAAPDHPQHPALPETAYLKSLLLQLD